MKRIIYCCACKKGTEAEKIWGSDVYPNREDLYKKRFYRCPACLNYVGTHKGSEKPLGVIPTPIFKNMHREIHSLIDPLWEFEGKEKRNEVYRKMKKLMKLGRPYHTAELRTLEEHNTALSAAHYLSQGFSENISLQLISFYSCILKQSS
jgi:hypothetical protein